MPGLAKDPTLASARSVRTATGSDANDDASAAQSIVKNEHNSDDDDGGDDDDVYRSRPPLQQGAVFMRTLADLTSK